MMRGSVYVVGGFVALGALVLLFVGTARAEDDKERVQGTWKVIKAEVGKQRADKELKRELEVIFDGKKFTVVDGDKKETAHFSLDPDEKPRTIDFFEDAEGKKKSWHGIYEFDGKELKLCWGAAGDKRPREFEVRRDSDDRYFVLRKK